MHRKLTFLTAVVFAATLTNVAIVQAATEVIACQTLTNGRFFLGSSFSFGAVTCFNITGSGVLLEFRGSTLTNTTGTGTGVRFGPLATRSAVRGPGEIRDANVGIFNDGADKVSISGLWIADSVGSAMDIIGGVGGAIKRNVLYNNGSHGIRLRGSAEGYDVYGNEVSRNTLDGILLLDTATGNEITGNNTSFNVQDGIDLGNSTTLNEVSGNISLSNGGNDIANGNITNVVSDNLCEIGLLAADCPTSGNLPISDFDGRGDHL